MTSAGGTNNIGTIFNYALLTTGTVENIEKIGFAVYPNPSNGTIAIEAERNEYMLHITNVLGEIIYQSKIKNYKSEIDLGKQTNGIYFINIQTVKGTAVQKLIINK